MPTNYFTLRQLVREWAPFLAGRTILDVYSQERGELTVQFESTDREASPSLKISVQAPLRYIYLNPNTARARKNVADLLPSLVGERVQSIAIPINDRPIEFELESGKVLRIELYGPRANVYLLDADRGVLDRFRSIGMPLGSTIPSPTPVELPSSSDELHRAMASGKGDLEKRLRRAVPTLSKEMRTRVLGEGGKEAVQDARKGAGRDAGLDPPPTEDEARALYEAIRTVMRELEDPSPHIVWEGRKPAVLSLLPHAETDAPGYGLQETTGTGGERETRSAEEFESVSEAVQIFVRKSLAWMAFEEAYRPLDKLLSARLTKAERSLSRMKEELETASRADRYEHFGHVLMALQTEVPAGLERVELPDIIVGTGTISIPLKSELDAVQNAETYYRRAREARISRKHAVERLDETEQTVQHLQSLVDVLATMETVADVRDFKTTHAESLAALSDQSSTVDSGIPFRRFVLSDGYEVWVGRNARQNDELTLRAARKYDLWLHARGVAGSHTVLRVPRRGETPPSRVVDQAASIAAHYSKAKTSEFAPVIVTEARFVRKPSKSPSGTVVVERERVLIVRPELPAN